MNDAVAAYIIDHVDWTPAAEFLAHNDIHEAAVMNDLEQHDDPDDEALDIDTETSTVEECLSARSKYPPSSTSTTEGQHRDDHVQQPALPLLQKDFLLCHRESRPLRLCLLLIVWAHGLRS